MMLSSDDWSAIRLTLTLAGLTTVLLLLLGTPIAWWLARTRSRLQRPISALITLPMVLPPSVLGFYLLVLMGAQGPVGRFTEFMGWGLLPFSFAGLVVGSVLYSLPFVVQPLQQSFAAISEGVLEVAATLRASPIDRFFSIALPLARPGLITATVMGFAHTLGEFGVVLMIGGNIPGTTRVLSVQIYNHVEALEFTQGHRLAGAMLLFSFVVLWLLFRFQSPASYQAER